MARTAKGTEELDIRTDSIDLNNPTPEFYEPESLQVIEDMNRADELAFMEEFVEVILSRGVEQHAPKSVQVGVNGEVISIPTGTPVHIRRKFLNNLLTSVHPSFNTRIVNTDDGDRLNFLDITRNLRHNVSPLKDTPRGLKWFREVTAAVQ